MKIKLTLLLCVLVVLSSCKTTKKKQYAEAEKRTLYVVIHKDNPVEKISLKDITRIYLGKKGKWDNLVSITRYDYPPLQKAFYEQVLEMPTIEVERYWSYQKFMAGPPRPILVKRAKDLVSILQKELGGIGYITTKKIPNSLKVIATFEVVRK